MRRFLPLLLLLGSACTAEASQRSVPGEPLPPDAATQIAVVEDTARAFIDAHARPRSTARVLAGLVDGTDMREWVRWEAVHHEGADILPRGDVEVRALRVTALGTTAALVAVEAVTTMRFREADGDVARIEDVFTSPMLLALSEQERAWKVRDVIRDGRAMGASISPLEPPIGVDAGPAEVGVESVFRFTADTVVNVRIQNTGSEPLRVLADESVLATEGSGLLARGTTVSLDRSIAPGATVAGSIVFPDIPLTTIPEGLVLELRGARPLEIEIELPPEPFVLPPT